jgi:predicted SAM-dependent methyltransferase
MPLLLNVGCHDIHLAGFVNIDLDPGVKPDLVWDATRLREMYQDETVDFIYSGHFLEHLPIAKSGEVVKDFFKLLRPYGIAIIVVPDYTKVGGMTVPDAESVILDDGQHKSIFNRQRLIQLVRDSGFISVYEVPVKDLPWCRFPEVIWQTAVIAIKHDPVTFATG